MSLILRRVFKVVPILGWCCVSPQTTPTRVSPECEVWGHPQGLPGSAAAGQGAQPGRHRGQLPRGQHVQGPRDVHPGHLRRPLCVQHGREFSPFLSEDWFSGGFNASASHTYPFAVPRRSLATR